MKTTTPSADELISIFGGVTVDGVTFSTEEFRYVARLYGYQKEPTPDKPPPPTAPDRAAFPNALAYESALRKYEVDMRMYEKRASPESLEQLRQFMQAGADKNMLRYAARDGLRLIAWLARYVSPGGDPLKLLIQMANAAGFDVWPADTLWAEDDEDPEETDDEDGKLSRASAV